MTPKRNHTRRGRRRWVFRHRLQAMLERHDDGWHVFVGTRDCGIFNSVAAAEKFVDKIAGDRRGGDDGGR